MKLGHGIGATKAAKAQAFVLPTVAVGDHDGHLTLATITHQPRHPPPPKAIVGDVKAWVASPKFAADMGARDGEGATG